MHGAEAPDRLRARPQGQSHARLDEASHFLQDDQGTEIARRLVEFYSSPSVDLDASGRGHQYCGILLGHLDDAGLTAEVWGTPFLNDCPAALWEALDPSGIQAEYDAVFIQMNGPRYGLSDNAEFELPGRYRTYGDLDMRLLATLVVDPAQVSGGAYTEAVVLQTKTFEFWAGSEVYELTSADGAVYVMQSMSQIVDPDLTLEQLPSLGERLELPDGWSYEARTLEEDLVLVIEGEAIVLQDELKNSHQRR